MAELTNAQVAVMAAATAMSGSQMYQTGTYVTQEATTILRWLDKNSE